MGSGKSRIGKEIAKLYKFDFYDTDSEIEKKYGKSIDYIFKNYGENYFRELEEAECLNILEIKNCVISLGGGSILNKKIREKISKYSFSIYLKVDLDVLYERLKYSKKRPLLKNADKKEKIKKIYNLRKQFYNNADIVLENNLSKNNIIQTIISKLKN